MLGQLVSMRDEEVLHAVHGRICLCWCVFFFPLSVFFVFFPRERKVGRLSRRFCFFPTCSGRITGTAAQLRPSLGERRERGGRHEETKRGTEKRR